MAVLDDVKAEGGHAYPISDTLVRLARYVADGRRMNWRWEFGAIATHLAKAAGVPEHPPAEPK